MVLLWLLKIIYGIALYGFVIESNFGRFKKIKNLFTINTTEFYRIKN